MTTVEHVLPEFRVRRSTRTSTVGAFAALPLFALLVAAPYLFGRSGADQLVQLFILIIIGTMWNLLAGYAGMVSIGQQAYMGIGAYGLFAAVNLWGIHPFIALGVGVVIAAVLSLPISFLVFRLTGGYFAIATWVVAEVIRQIVGRIPALSQGGVGTMTMDADRIAPTPGTRSAYIYWAALIGVAIVITVTYLMMRSRLGSGFRAIRDEPVAAASVGVSVMRGKRIAYVVAAAGCALGGALLALSLGQVRPDSMFRVDFSTWMIFIVVIGGLGTIEGPIIGAIVFFLLQTWLGGVGSWYLVILGVIAIVITLVLPRGLWGLAADRGIRLFPIGSRLELGSGTQDVRARAGHRGPAS